MARRKKSARRSPRRTPAAAPARDVPWVPIALAAVAAGGAALLFWRAASASSAPVSPVGSQLPAVTPGIAPSPSGSNVPQIPADIAQRLASSDAARKAFALQALLYETGVTDHLPDGDVSHASADLADLASISGGVVQPTLSDGSTAQVRAYMAAQHPGLPMTALPYAMPMDLINQVNASARATDPGYGSLVVFPVISPGARAIQPAA